MPRVARRIVSLVLVLVFLTGTITCQAAQPDVSAASCVLMDADSGRVLLAKGELEERPIASTTKIMTALVALRHSRLTDVVTVRREHLKEGSSMYLREGETLTMEALLYGLMLPSGNDAAECIADFCGGGTETFVRWMNETAASLGMEHTSFRNPSGLDAEGHYSCALDMAKLMAYAMRDPTFAQIVSAKTATVGNRTMANHNKLLGAVEGCIGGKTGYTDGAGRTLVTCAERGGLRLVAVTLRDGNDWQDHTALYEYGFSTYRNETLISRGKPYALVSVRGGEAVCAELVAAERFCYPLAEGETPTLRVEAQDAVRAPVRAGEALGQAVITLDGEELGRVALIAAQGVKAATAKPRRLWGLFGR